MNFPAHIEAAPTEHDGGWQPIETMPWQTVCEVRNSQMQQPCLATRGYSHNGMVHPNDAFCTSLWTPDASGLGFPGGRLVCPDEWREVQP